MKLFSVIVCALPLCLAAPARRAASTPTVTIAAPQGTIVGVGGSVEKFAGIPFAKPPVGPLRLRPPQPLTNPLGTFLATNNGQACPQLFFSDKINDAIPTAEIGMLLDTPLFQKVLNAGEDCLYLNIQRPAGTTPSSKLPVLFWIYGGGFELGWNYMYDGSGWVSESVAEGQPMIYVSVNYRVGGFGFMPGKEILADGSANLGLLDQRLGLQWVADNIAAFGGDPAKVTIWGESAGAISVLDQMVMYNGDNTYKGKPLFRGAMMNSGSVIPADPVDCPKGQFIYDTVVQAAGCSSASDTLACLRTVPYQTMLAAANSVPGILSYSAVALSYLPRPDGTALTASPDVLVQNGKFAKVPFIVGDQEDEGTLFSLFQSNITTTQQIVQYLKDFYFSDATPAQIEGLVATYQDQIYDGSPFRTGILNGWYPQFKRLAAILGDLTFTLTRRSFLDTVHSVAPNVPTWSYMSSYDYGTPILGTFHGSDILQVFYGLLPNYASMAFHSYYISFVNKLDPNAGAKFSTWPQWAASKQLLNMYPTTSVLITDNFRADTYSYLLSNIPNFHI